MAVSAGSPTGGQQAVGFQYTGVSYFPNQANSFPNYLVVSPSKGTTSTSNLTSAEILIALNPTVVAQMGPGRYQFRVNFSTVGQTPPATTNILADLIISAPPSPVVSSVLNAASLQPALAPGALVSIFGKNFGPAVGSVPYGDQGLYPTTLSDGSQTLSNTTVTFAGIAAPLTYVSANQINAMVPYGVAGMASANVVVNCYNQSSAPVSVPLQATAPALFTANSSGSGQGAILNVNPTSLVTSYNSGNNPAARGVPVVMYATGMGPWSPSVADGAIALAITNPMCNGPNVPLCTKLVNGPLSLTIGGKPATVFYAGTAVYEPWSLLQINAYVPMDAPSGQQPVVLKIGSYDNSAQNVTMAIQ